jgi:hypothetical protein
MSRFVITLAFILVAAIAASEAKPWIQGVGEFNKRN